MSRSRDKRVTLRFHMDDPGIVGLYTTLQQKRRATGKSMNALIMDALRASLGEEDRSEKLLRQIVREEVRVALKGWVPQAIPQSIEDDDSDFDSLAAATKFTL